LDPARPVAAGAEDAVPDLAAEHASHGPPPSELPTSPTSGRCQPNGGFIRLVVARPSLAPLWTKAGTRSPGWTKECPATDRLPPRVGRPERALMYSRLAATVAAGVLVMSGLATGTANASTPHRPTVAVDDSVCGKVTLSVTTEAPPLHLLYLRYEVDGRERTPLRVKPSKDTVKTITFDEDSGVHWVRYRLSSANEWSKVGPVKTNCQPVRVRADAPSVVQPECDATRGKLTIPSDRGVFYKVRVGSRPY